MNAPAIEIEDVVFSYQALSASMRFNCQFEGGKITALMGASGSGKSTLLSLIAGFEQAKSGDIRIGGQSMIPLGAALRPVSMLFQSNNLFAHLNVMQNVGLGLQPDLRLSDAQCSLLEETLSAVGLAGLGARMPEALSGGQRQRVALARAMVRDRPVLLLDEAFASLGQGLRYSMLDLVADIVRQNSMTAVMVTHSIEDAQRIADDLVFLEDGHVAAAGAIKAVLADPPAQMRRYLRADNEP